jgi:NAD(P)H-quinone oxidoreductase subunit 5
VNWLPPTLLAAPAVSLLVLGLIPSRRSMGGSRRLSLLATILTGLSLLTSVAAAVLVLTVSPIDASLIRFAWPIPLSIGVYADAITVVMMCLISFIGLIICRYSARYLLGDPGQGRFFRWMPFTVGATLLMVMSCNLVMFTVAWMFTSFGLHQLLTHYPERTWSIWAARKKFLISRLGDVMLVAALVITYFHFGTTEYADMFAAANRIHAGTAEGGWSTALIGFLLVLGAITKSAQFPFHTWLPDTMETPTPVSALMHAGVINAGGFLVIRLSPLISLSPVALDLLALIGAITALMASMVMLTQTSIKRVLAYSTIAQMGFMMLQCGLGAFSAALLHIVAHSAYKAHAFLSCGSVLDAAERTNSPAIQVISSLRQSLGLIAVSIVLAAGITFGTFAATGIDILSKPGGAIVGLILTLALTQLLWNGFATGIAWLALRSALNSVLVTTTYCIAYRAMDHLVGKSASHPGLAASALDIPVLVVVGLGFGAVFAIQALSAPLAQRRWIKALYVHAMNGFYFDIPARRLTGWFYRQAAPVQ